jgi:hypothetical protein
MKFQGHIGDAMRLGCGSEDLAVVVLQRFDPVWI